MVAAQQWQQWLQRDGSKMVAWQWQWWRRSSSVAGSKVAARQRCQNCFSTERQQQQR
jgi:hypothetical protein